MEVPLFFSCSLSCEEQQQSSAASSYASVLRKCARVQDLKTGRRVHSEIISGEHRRSLFLSNLVIEMYGKCGEVGEAYSVFRSIGRPNVFSWNIMISAFAQNGNLVSAKRLFDSMLVRDEISWNTMVAAYAQNGRTHEALELFSQMKPPTETACCVLITALAVKGDISKAEKLFDFFKSRNLFLWTAMMSAYAQNGLLKQARNLFEQMPERCLVTWNTLISANARYGDLVEARNLFERIPQRDVVAWTSMISGCSQNGQGSEAILLFRMMSLEGCVANEVTFVSCLNACSSVAALALGRVLHQDSAMKPSFTRNILLGNALVSMYGKCGCLDDAKLVFDKMLVHDVVSWTSMVTVHAHSGLGRAAVEFFRGMIQNGVKPDGVSLVGVLYACKHAGMLEIGRSCFTGIKHDFEVDPRVEHFVCLIDILGRTGKLSEVEELIGSMPFEPNLLAWSSLLSSCRVHRDLDRAKRAAERVLELDSDDIGPYLVLSTLHASLKNSDDAAAALRRVAREKKKKARSVCWVQIKGRVHEFIS